MRDSSDDPAPAIRGTRDPDDWFGIVGGSVVLLVLLWFYLFGQGSGDHADSALVPGGSRNEARYQLMDCRCDCGQVLKPHGYAGSYRATCPECAKMFGHDLDDFVRDLRVLEARRSGDARLESGDEFRLELKPVDQVGHYEACVSLGTYQYSGPTYWLTKLSGGFEIDPSQLPGILRAFEELAAFCKGEA